MTGVALPLRDYQAECIDAVRKEWDNGVARTAVVMPTGCHRAGQHILMHDGTTKPVEGVMVGDLLMGPDGVPRTVLQLVRGVGPMMEIRPVKGEPWVVNDQHVLTLVETAEKADSPYPSQRGGAVRDVPLPEWELWSKTRRHRHKLFRTGVDFPAREPPPLDPYFLGVVLGDGSLSVPYRLSVATPDPEIVETCHRIAEQHGVHIRVDGRKGIQHHFTSGHQKNGRRGGNNPLLPIIRDLGLCPIACEDRFIPDCYRLGSREVRLGVLAGLLDTDGALSRGGCYDYGSKSERLARDVAFVSRSLGLAAYVSKRPDGHYRVSISGDCSILPLRVARKIASPREQKKNHLRTGFGITPTGTVEPYCGFTLSGDGRYLLDDFTVTHNSGKTITFSHMAAVEEGRTLVLAHRAELIDQAAAKIRAVAPELNVGVDMAERWADTSCRAVVASVQTLASEKRRRRWERNAFAQVIVDECFPIGTPVGNMPIESLRTGDLVPSWNEEFGQVEMRRVVQTMRRRPSSMVRVTTQSGESFACTPGHPFLTTSGWLPAKGLGGAYLMRASHGTTSGNSVHGMRHEGHTDHEGEDRPIQKQGASILHGDVPGYVGVARQVATNVQDQQNLRRGAHAAEEPDALRKSSGAGGDYSSGDWARPGISWRKRSSGPGTAAQTSGIPGMADRRLSGTGRQPAAVALQTGHRTPGDEGVRRGRRGVSLLEVAAGSRPEERRAPARDRVDSVQVLEPGSDRTYGGVCPDGLVYNLEVEATHTYLIGCGFVAHNCHHAAATTYLGVLGYFGCMDEVGGTRTAGFTATLQRGDGVGLGSVWQTVAYRRDILEMIADGYLVNPTGIAVPVDADFTAAPTSGGDYTAAGLGGLLEDAGFEKAVAQAYLEHAGGRPGIVFTPTVATAQAAAKALCEAGVKAEAVWGEMDPDARKAAVEGLRDGTLDVLCNCQILTEGTDIPRAEVAIMARPTQSESLYQQMAGRVFRPFPGKDGALIVDLVGVTADHRLCSLIDLAAGQVPDREEDDRAEDGETLVDAVQRITHVTLGAARTVDLFAKSQSVWLQTAGGHWFVPAGGGHVALLPGPGGQYAVALFPPGKTPPKYSRPAPGLTLAMALGEERARAADAAAERGFSSVVRAAGWRAKEPSRKQLELAARMRIEVPPGARLGEVSDLIEVKIASRRIDRHFTHSTRRTSR